MRKCSFVEPPENIDFGEGEDGKGKKTEEEPELLGPGDHPKGVKNKNVDAIDTRWGLHAIHE